MNYNGNNNNNIHQYTLSNSALCALGGYCALVTTGGFFALVGFVLFNGQPTRQGEQPTDDWLAKGLIIFGFGLMSLGIGHCGYHAYKNRRSVRNRAPSAPRSSKVGLELSPTVMVL